MRIKKTPPIVIKGSKMILQNSILKKVFPTHKFQITLFKDYFLITGIDRYAPDGLQYACRNPLPISDELKIRSPIVFHPDEDTGRLFALDFGGSGDPQVMLGTFDGRIRDHTMFTPADTYESTLNSTHILIRIRWTRDAWYKCGHLASIIKPDYFCSIAGNSGLRGVEYWVFPFSRVECDDATLWTFKMRHAFMKPTEIEATNRLQRLADHLPAII